MTGLYLVVLHDGSGLSLRRHIHLAGMPSLLPFGAGNIHLVDLSASLVRLVCLLLSLSFSVSARLRSYLSLFSSFYLPVLFPFLFFSFTDER